MLQSQEKPAIAYWKAVTARDYLCVMDIRFTQEEIGWAASEFWAQAGNARVFAFYGEMGTGKTTFIKALCKIRQVREPVSSPTYSIINEYKAYDGRLFHIDLYRLKDEEEAILAGVEECLYSGDICLVEWPEKAPSLFPESSVHVFIEPVNETTRRIRIGGN